MSYMNYRILWKKNNVADKEATTYSIFYNNTLFLFFMLIMSFYLLRSFNPGVYPFFKFFLCVNISLVGFDL